MDDPIKSARDGVALVGEILKAAGENPNVKEAGSNLGQTALTITKTINNALLPLAAVNFAFDKARRYFAERFQEDISRKASAIPVGDMVEPKASIAGPALQGLAFTHEEPNLKDMYLSLLATAMDGRVAPKAHPAFVEIIKQLNSEEASLLRGLLNIDGSVPIAEVRISEVGQQGWRVLTTHLMNLCNLTDGTPVETPRNAAMVDNWLRLGLVEVDYGKQLIGVDAYAWVEKRPEYFNLRSQREDEKNILSFGRGVIGRTALGLQFAKAAGLLQ